MKNSNSNTPNWPNRSIYIGDNLNVMRSMNDACVDLIYLDPPFNSNRTYSAPIGSDAAGASFKDTWTRDDVDDAWAGLIAEEHPAVFAVCRMAELAHSDGMYSYLVMMGKRLIEMRRILKDTGSIYLHCDPTASHYLKPMMDAIFGRGNFRNEIVWGYKASNSPVKAGFPSKHDTVLFYAKSDKTAFNPQYTPYGDEYIKKSYRHIDGDGRRYRKHSKRADGSERRLYLDEGKGTPVLSWWTDIKGFGTVTQSKERTGYPTQKPIALIERIIKASTNEGDVVLDPFCGCATTCVAAETLGRQWVGIDISGMAYDLIEQRLIEKMDDGVLFKGGRYQKPHKFENNLPPKQVYGGKMSKRKAKPILFGRSKGRCNKCEHDFPYEMFDVDHVHPKALNGPDALENYQLLCVRCHRFKGTLSDEAHTAKLRKLKIVK